MNIVLFLFIMKLFWVVSNGIDCLFDDSAVMLSKLVSDVGVVVVLLLLVMIVLQWFYVIMWVVLLMVWVDVV